MKPTTPASGRPREWAPRIWQGCDFLAWMRLLSRNNFAVHLSHLYIAVVVTLVSIFHTLLRWLQNAVYGSKLDKVHIKDAPIFIVGHWRTGTTLLHELLILDPRHTFPNTYQCLEPNHFLLTENLVKRYLGMLMPSHRPMDNMKAGWDRPQEDEFALCMMGQPSPYLMIAFPNRPPIDQDAFSFENWSERKRTSWKQAFLGYLKRLTYKDPRRLILKSPTHSCRIPTLLELFPDARFIHIVRNPYVVFPSTVNLWKSLSETHGLQKPHHDGWDEYVLRTFTHLYGKLEAGRRLVASDRFYELRYEELVRDPLGEMRKLYAHLGLTEFDQVRPRFESYLAENRDYQTNRYPTLAPALREQITQRWAEVLQRYGYSDPSTP